MDELEQIVQNMIDAGEPEANIQLVIESYKPSKKKVSASPAPKQNLASTTKAGSSATSKLRLPKEEEYEQVRKQNSKLANQPVRLSPKSNTLYDLDMEGNPLPNSERNVKAAELSKEFKQSTSITDEDKTAVQQEIEAEVENRGIWNNAKSIFRSFGSYLTTGAFSDGDPLRDELQEIAQAEGTKGPYTEAQREKAKELKLRKRLDEVKDTKVNSFLSNIPERDKQLLFADNVDRLKSVSENDKNLLKAAELKKAEQEDLFSQYTSLKSTIEEKQKSGQQVSKEEIQQAQELFSTLMDNDKDLNATFDKYQKNREHIGSLEEEFDVLKRNYGWSENFFGRLGMSAKNIGLGLMDFAAMSNPQLPANALVPLYTANERKKIEKAKEFLRKDVESVEDVGSFFDYTTDMVADQLPVLAVTATGLPGLGAIAASSAGEKYSDMYVDTIMGKKSFTPYQMVASSLLHGSFEGISEIPTLGLLKRAGRVMSATGADDLVKKSFAKKAAEWSTEFATDTGKEVSAETFTQLMQNLNKIVVDGDTTVNIQDGVEDVIKDAATLTAILKIAPHVAGRALKPFYKKEDNTTIEKNALTIQSLSEKLNNPDLKTETAAEINGAIERMTKESSDITVNAIKSIEQLPEKEYKEVLGIEKKSAEFQNRASAIKSDPALDDETKDNLIAKVKKDYDAAQDRKAIILTTITNDKDSNIPDNNVSQDNPATNDNVPANSEPVQETQKPPINETAPENDIAADGNIRPDVGGLQQDGGPQSVTGENLSPGNDVGASESKPEVETDAATSPIKNSNLQDVVNKTYDAKAIVKNLFEKAKNNLRGTKREVIGIMSEEQKNQLAEISGLPFKDITTLEISQADLRHIYKGHYQENEKGSDRNIPLTDLDIENIPDVVFNPDDVTFEGFDKLLQQNKFRFSKQAEDGVYYLIEAYGKRGGSLTVKTFYKRKKGISQRPDAETPVSTSDNASAAFPSSDANIQKDSDTQNITTLDKILNQDDVKGTLDFLDSLKLDPNDLKATLPFLPQTWNTFIEAVKLSIKAGNTIRNAVNEAIRQLEGNGVARDEIRAVQARFEKLYNLQEEKATALKNADIAEKRLELGLEPREAVVPLANKDLIAQAEEKIKSGYDVEGLIDEVLEANSTKTLTNEEVIILKQYQLGKEDQLIEIGPKIVAAAKEGKQTKLDKLTDERNKLVDDIDRAYRAGERSGTMSARSLQARRIAILHDYSLANMLIQRRKANNNEKLTPEQIESTTAEYQKIKELNEKLQAKVQNLEEENNRLKAEKQFQKVLSLEKRKRGRKEKISEIDKSIDDVLASLKKTIKEQQGRLSSNALPVEMIPDIARLAVLYAQKGIVNLNQVVDNIHASLVDDIPNLTKSDIEEIIGSYDYEGEAKNNARLETLKKRTSKRIEELRKKLEEKNFAKKELNPVKLDKEAQKLKDELRQAKFEWDKALESDRLSQRTKLEKANDFTVDLLNVPRSVMASIDYSAPLRQGLVMTINHPILASRAFSEMFKQGFSQLRFDRWMENLTESPEYELLEKAGLYIANTNKSNAKLSAKEEQFMSNLANKIPIIGAGFNVKVKGKPVRVFGMNPTGGLNLIGGSERAYVSYLNKLRVDVFLQAAGAFQSDGLTIENKPELYEALATYVNAATGRGDIGKFEDSAGILNALFFSPRLIASRIRLLTNWANPMWYAKTPARVRRMYALDMLRFIGAGTSILALASLAGADVEENPLSTDFGKIKIGNTRWDIWGGFQQFVRYISQISYGAEKKGNKIIDFGKSNRDKYSRTGAGLKLVRSKLAPVPATIVSWGLGTDPVGNDYDYTDLPNSFMPLFASDLYNAIEREGPKAAATTGLPAVFGIGVITYDERKKK